MCGIAGIYNLNGSPIDQALLVRMTDIIRHRGPDDEGYLLIQTKEGKAYPAAGKETIPELQTEYPHLPLALQADLGFGFRRLSILDLSAKGHQPMQSADGRYWIIFNGEIYNYQEIRAELEHEGYTFYTHSDTEVILCAYDRWKSDCQSRFNGMWALAIYDRKAHTLFCSRDRYGIKPLYYALHDNVLYFGSELKQILFSPVSKELNLSMLHRSMKINALLAHGDETYFRQIKSLKAGHSLIIREEKLSVQCYDDWDISSFESSNLSFSEAVSRYRDIFLDSVRLQMRSDVEVGSCLSGGMDSSAIVCTAAGYTDKRFQTFSSYYAEDKTLDERKWIDIVAKQTNSLSHLVSPVCNKTIDWFEKATWHNDLPAGSGFVSQYAVMEMAHKQGVKVLLDGQGSDELTAGYNHAFYRYFADLLRKGQLLSFIGNLTAYTAAKSPAALFKALPRIMMSVLMGENTLYRMEYKHFRFEPFSPDFLEKMQSPPSEGGTVNSPNANPLSEIADLPVSRLSNFLYNMMHYTSIQTLLHYEDRMAMAHGVESRVPFLDHRLVQFAFSLPSEYKIKPPFGKYVHREAMKDIIPESIYNRRDKAIFGSPFYSSWLPDKLSGYVNDILISQSFRQRGIYNLPLIERKWRVYDGKNKADGEMIYNLIALENWFRVFGLQ